MRLRLSAQLACLGIIVAAFALRAGLLQATAEIPTLGDESVYYALGERLIEDLPTGLRAGAFLKRTPALPFLLASVRLTIGHEPYHAKWMLIFASTISVSLGYALAWRLFGYPAGLAAALFLALYPEFVVFSTLLFTETPFITLTLASFLLLVHYTAQPRPILLLLSGILWALAILTRDQALYFTPFIALWLAWHHPGPLLRRLLPSALFLGIVLIGLSPWVARNLWATGRFALVTQREGITFFRRWGNHDPQLDLEAWCAQWKALAGDRGARQRFALNTALDYITRNPLQWFVNKVALMWKELSQVGLEALDRIEHNMYGIVLPRYTWAILWITAIGFLMLSIGWILGVVSASSNAGRTLLFIYLGYSTMLHILIALNLRFRLPVLAILSLFAGYFWAQPLSALQRMRTHPIAGLVGAGLLILLLTSLNLQEVGIGPAREARTCIGNLPR